MAIRPFIGTHQNKVDQKGRVSVPAKFRAGIAQLGYESIVVRFDDKRGCLEGSGWDRLERIAEDAPDFVDGDDLDSEDAADLFADFEELNFDPAGRVVLSEALRGIAGITESAVFRGTGRFFQIWSPEGLEAYQAKRKGGTA
ncbi:MAG: division/cell wall cluster transcriptional repressor MraZ [Rhodospirillaceae bacterium]